MKIALTEPEMEKLRMETQGAEAKRCWTPTSRNPPSRWSLSSPGGIDVLAAAYMAYDEPMDGLYLTDRIEDSERLSALVRAYLAAC
jgi:hypothetical protein